jgi:hypothetical protein
VTLGDFRGSIGAPGHATSAALPKSTNRKPETRWGVAPCRVESLKGRSARLHVRGLIDG